MTPLDEYFNIFFDYVGQLYLMSSEEKAICRKFMRPKTYQKDNFISKEGEVPRYHNFIISGYARNYRLDNNFDEVTVDFNAGPRFFTSYEAFLNRTRSHENLHCVTDCQILRLERDVLEDKTFQTPGMLEYSSLILQQSWQQEKQRLIERTTLSAEERYRKLMLESPAILKNYPLKYIASYLGIQPGSLSRIRREVTLQRA